MYLGAALQHESPDDALPQFKAALRLDSKYKAALLGMAVCLEARGNLPSCINYYQQAIGTFGACSYSCSCANASLWHYSRCSRGVHEAQMLTPATIACSAE